MTGVAFLLVAFAATPIDAGDLRRLPGVEKVASGKLHPRKIIHILDWHFVQREAFAADVEAGSDEELDRSYEQHLKDVETVQAEQLKLLSHLSERHDVAEVFIEGFSQRDQAIVDAMVRVLRKRSMVAHPTAEDEKTLNEEVRLLRLKVGAAGQLAAIGHLRLVPAEDETAYRLANPQTPNGIKFDKVKNEARESAIVENLLSGDQTIAVIVLGGAHDLSDNVPDGVEYIRVTPRNYPKMDKQ